LSTVSTVFFHDGQRVKDITFARDDFAFPVELVRQADAVNSVMDRRNG
jgi:hypothetical protein